MKKTCSCGNQCPECPECKQPECECECGVTDEEKDVPPAPEKEPKEIDYWCP